MSGQKYIRHIRNAGYMWTLAKRHGIHLDSTQKVSFAALLYMCHILTCQRLG